MNSSDHRTGTNLRLLGTIEKNQYMRTDRKYDIIGIVGDTPYNMFMSMVFFDTWNSTKYSLRKIFTTDIPELHTRLIKKERCEELKNLRILLYNAAEGLRNLKWVYKNDELAIANIDSITDDYINIQISDIESYLTSKNEKFEIFNLKRKISDGLGLSHQIQ